MEILDDLETISELSDEQFQEITSLLSTPSVDDLEWTLAISKAEDAHPGDSIEKLVRFLYYISEKIISSSDVSKTKCDLNNEFIKITEGNEKALAGWDKVAKNLDELEGFWIKRKEDEIESRFNRLESFEITTDLRPVFNLQKTEVIKDITVHILKLSASGRKDFICEFQGDSIDGLISELTMAKEKERLLKERYES